MQGTPWDIYIDERKDPHWSLGFLIVPNTASFLHKLYLARHVTNRDGVQEFRGREIHWHQPRGDILDVAVQWMQTLFQHRGAQFYLKPWPRGQAKEYVVLEFLARFCADRRLHQPYNVVTILDFDSSHAKRRIQNTIRETGGILRCYHLDSRNNDCLQCCDLFLGALTALRNDPTVRFGLDGLVAKRKSGQRLSDSEIKRFWAGTLGNLIDSLAPSVYDLRRGLGQDDTETVKPNGT